ncbi:MAG TPA: DUF1501 domain-containing protein, partial [Saprospiraceae bacterium]|nr:DUF1501 domain-containing protein [Saprospiraceae bacterium]
MSIDNKNHKLYNTDLGKEHADEHVRWNRRQFLMTNGLAGLGSMFLSGIPISAAISEELAQLAMANTDNILVLVKMFGGNDGLNMVFPHTSAAGVDEYYQLRPTIAQKKGTNYTDNQVLSGFGNDGYAIPSTMDSIMPLWREGKMGVIHNVGYANQDYSHFASIDIWASASDSFHDKRINNGYIGRYLSQEFPSFAETPPTVPPALRIGYSTDLIFSAPGRQQMELVFNSPRDFFTLAQYGKLYATDGFGDCPQGEEREFVRQLTNSSLRYSQTVIDAYNRSTNKVNYPTGTTSNLASQLSIVSRLIKGNLGTKIYMVYIDGFDTHTSQANSHPRLLGNLADSVSAFYNDLKADNAQSNVTLMTFSEFGRTIKENGTQGTDHGNLAPMMIFGDAVKGGHYGTPINLQDPILKTNTVVYYESQPSTDFRKVYSGVLQDYLCLDSEVVDYALGQSYNKLNLFKNPCGGGSQGSNLNTILIGHSPNESDAKMIDIKFSQLGGSEVELTVKSLNGKTLAILLDKYAPKGSYKITFDPAKWKISSGEYIYELKSSGKLFTRRFSIF